MAILGKDPFGKMNPLYNGIQNKEETNKDEQYNEEFLTKDFEAINKEVSQTPQDPNVSGSLEYLDRMRKMNSFNKKPIGNQIRSDAQLFNKNNKSGL